MSACRRAAARRPLPHAAQTQFWKAAAEECAEEHVGLHLAGHLPAFHGLLLEYLFLSSETFGEGLRHALRYVRLLSDTLNARLEVEGERAVLSLGQDASINRHFPEMLAGAVIRLFDALTEGDFKACEVQLMHTEGAAAERYLAVYGCPARLAPSATRWCSMPPCWTNPRATPPRNCCACTNPWPVANWPKWNAWTWCARCAS